MCVEDLMDPGAVSADEAGTSGLLAEALRLVRAASDANITLRLAGSLAIRLRCSRSADLFSLLGRERYGDIDFLAPEREWKAVDELLTSDGYAGDPQLARAQEYGIQRLIYERPDGSVKIDVFLDRVVMSHTVDYRGRLGEAERTVSSADLLLSKLQVHDITAKDVIDLLVLVRDGWVTAGEDAHIDKQYVLRILCDNWGFWYTAMANLATAAAFTGSHEGLGDQQRAELTEGLGDLRKRLEDEPKSRKWRLRSRVGTRVRWYEPVEEVRR
jgi:hypothetical protein